MTAQRVAIVACDGANGVTYVGRTLPDAVLRFIQNDTTDSAHNSTPSNSDIPDNQIWLSPYTMQLTSMLLKGTAGEEYLNNCRQGYESIRRLADSRPAKNKRADLEGLSRGTLVLNKRDIVAVHIIDTRNDYIV